MSLFQFDQYNGKIDPQTLTRQAIVDAGRQAFITALSAYQEIQRLQNVNPYGLSSDQVVQALGADAAELKAFTDRLFSLINTTVPGTL